MKVRILNEKQVGPLDVTSLVLKDRGINDVEHYLNTSAKDCIDAYNLDNMKEAIACFTLHANRGSHIHIAVDPDADGFSSGALLYNYIKDVFPKAKLSYNMPFEKRHGFHDKLVFPLDTELLIMPDAGSADFDWHTLYKNKGIDIIILDHHECDNGYSKNAIVVNNQLSSHYDNKNLSGVGIVYKFLKAIDEEMWEFHIDKYLDLVALGNVGDVMDMREYETKYLVDCGLSCINNRFLQECVKKNSYALGNGVTKSGMAWYIAPLINAMIRFGRPDEKELLFRALTEQYEEFDYQPKKDKPVVKENIYERAVRLCCNTKERQDKAKNKAISVLDNSIKANCNIEKDKILFAVYTDEIDNTLSGLSAGMLATKYRRPVLVGRLDDNGMVSGSARNYNKFCEQKLRSSLVTSNLFDHCEGHEGAFGFSISKEQIPILVEKFNKKYKDADIDSYYDVDYQFKGEEIDFDLCSEIDNLRNIWGTGVDEPLFYITDVLINTSDIIPFSTRVGSSSNYKFTVNNIEYVKWRCDPDDKILSYASGWSSDMVKISLVGKLKITEFEGSLIPSVFIEDYVIDKVW